MRLVHASFSLAIIAIVLVHAIDSIFTAEKGEYGKVFFSAAFATVWTFVIHVKGRGNEFLPGWWCFFWVNATFVLLLAPHPQPEGKCKVF
jgi:hypothetical protein